LLIVATAGVAEIHVTSLVRLWVELSEYVPVAINCSLMPAAMLGAGGVIAIATKTAGVTASVAALEREPQTLAKMQAALIVALPVPTVLINPLLLTVATDGFEEVHVRSVVTSTWLLSL
jgi:hypothetical protein